MVSLMSITMTAGCHKQTLYMTNLIPQLQFTYSLFALVPGQVPLCSRHDKMPARRTDLPQTETAYCINQKTMCKGIQSSHSHYMCVSSLLPPSPPPPLCVLHTFIFSIDEGNITYSGFSSFAFPHNRFHYNFFLF